MLVNMCIISKELGRFNRGVDLSGKLGRGIDIGIE